MLLFSAGCSITAPYLSSTSSRTGSTYQPSTPADGTVAGDNILHCLSSEHVWLQSSAATPTKAAVGCKEVCRVHGENKTVQLKFGSFRSVLQLMIIVLSFLIKFKCVNKVLHLFNQHLSSHLIYIFKQMYIK